MERNDSIFIPTLRAFSLVLVLSACGAASPAPRVVVHGKLDLSQTLPRPTPTPYEGYGARQGWVLKGVTPNSKFAVDPYLKPQPPAEPRVAVRAAERPPRTPSPVAARTAAPVSSSAAQTRASSDDTRAPATRVVSAEDAQVLASADRNTLRADAARYSQRQNRQLERYRGGDVIVIGVTTLLVILLVVLLLVLLL